MSRLRTVLARKTKNTSPSGRLVQATVTAITTPTLTLNLAGNAITGVHKAKGYTPTVGDTVWVWQQGPVLWVVDAQG